jgi:hypothetical protein
MGEPLSDPQQVSVKAVLAAQRKISPNQILLGNGVMKFWICFSEPLRTKYG